MLEMVSLQNNAFGMQYVNRYGCTYPTFAFPCGIPGPLVGVQGFHPSVIRWCAMHVVHLGLLFVANGSAMTLILT